MREIIFLKQNKEKWLKVEDMVKGKVPIIPDQLAEYFIEINDDLAFAQTHYPKSKVVNYLNSLVREAYHIINKNQKDRSNKLIKFWTEELPKEFYKARKSFLIAAIIFFLSMTIGIFSTAYDKDFPSYILGSGYVEMTKANIENGDPMEVYKDKNPTSMFLRICRNNLYVCFLTFLLGALLGTGSIFWLFRTGIMVGAFQYFFFEMDEVYPDSGALFDSLTTIWVHGTIEIASCIIAGAAGLFMGAGSIFTGTLPRATSFKNAAKTGVKIFISLVPLIIIAALLEGYVTRNTYWEVFSKEYQWIPRLVIIIISLVFVVFYFIILPLTKGKKLYLLEKENELEEFNYI